MADMGDGGTSLELTAPQFSAFSTPGNGGLTEAILLLYSMRPFLRLELMPFGLVKI